MAEQRLLRAVDDDDFRALQHAKRLLHVAYDKRDFETVGLLLDHGASLQFWYKTGYNSTDYQTLVDFAILSNDYSMLSCFKEHLWNVNERNPHGDTPLITACRGGTQMISCLTDWGANVDMQNYVMTPIDVCIKHCNRKGLQRLMRLGADINANYSLEYAITEYMDRVSIKYPFSQNIPHFDPTDPDDSMDDDDEVKRSRGIIRDILEYTVDFEFTIMGTRASGETMMLHARREAMGRVPEAIKGLVNAYRHRQTVEFLATLDPVDVDLQDEYGRTALHRAMKNGQLEAVKYLIYIKNARENKVDIWGRTASECLEATYHDMKMKVDHPERFVPRIGDGNRYVDIMRGERISDFQSIGRFNADRRLFMTKLGPAMIQAYELVKKLAGYVFS